jgi:MFS family permease
MITIFGRELLNVGPEGLGVLLSAPALGSLTGVVSLVALGQPRRSGRFAITCTFLYTAVLVAVALAPTFALAFVALAVTGFLDALVTVTRHSVMQLSAPGRMRGRIMANMGTITNGIGPLAQTQSGLLAAAIGPRMAIVAAAVALAAVGGATAWSNKALWRFTRVDARAAMDDDLAGHDQAAETVESAGVPEV